MAQLLSPKLVQINVVLEESPSNQINQQTVRMVGFIIIDTVNSPISYLRDEITKQFDDHQLEIIGSNFKFLKKKFPVSFKQESIIKIQQIYINTPTNNNTTYFFNQSSPLFRQDTNNLSLPLQNPKPSKSSTINNTLIIANESNEKQITTPVRKTEIIVTEDDNEVNGFNLDTDEQPFDVLPHHYQYLSSHLTALTSPMANAVAMFPDKLNTSSNIDEQQVLNNSNNLRKESAFPKVTMFTSSTTPPTANNLQISYIHPQSKKEQSMQITEDEMEYTVIVRACHSILRRRVSDENITLHSLLDTDNNSINHPKNIINRKDRDNDDISNQISIDNDHDNDNDKDSDNKMKHDQSTPMTIFKRLSSNNNIDDNNGGTASYHNSSPSNKHNQMDAKDNHDDRDQDENGNENGNENENENEDDNELLDDTILGLPKFNDEIKGSSHHQSIHETSASFIASHPISPKSTRLEAQLGEKLPRIQPNTTSTKKFTFSNEVDNILKNAMVSLDNKTATKPRRTRIVSKSGLTTSKGKQISNTQQIGEDMDKTNNNDDNNDDNDDDNDDDKFDDGDDDETEEQSVSITVNENTQLKSSELVHPQQNGSKYRKLEATHCSFMDLRMDRNALEKSPKGQNKGLITPPHTFLSHMQNTFNARNKLLRNLKCKFTVIGSPILNENDERNINNNCNVNKIKNNYCNNSHNIINQQLNGNVIWEFETATDLIKGLSGVHHSDTNPLWIDLVCDGETFINIAEHIRPAIHNLTMEDCLTIDCREKLEIFKDYLFICIRTSSENYTSTQTICILIFKTMIITYHLGTKITISIINDCRNILHKKFSNICPSPSWVCHTIIDNVIDKMMPEVESTVHEVEICEQFVFKLCIESQNELLERMQRARGWMVLYRSRLWPKSTISHNLLNNYLWRKEFLYDVPQPYWRDINDHVARMVDLLELGTQTLESIQNIFVAKSSLEMTQQSNNLAKVGGKLAGVGAVFLPLTVITGVWGMNCRVPFQYIMDSTLLFHDDLYGFIVVALLMVLSSFFTWKFVNHKGWVDPQKG